MVKNILPEGVARSEKIQANYTGCIPTGAREGWHAVGRRSAVRRTSRTENRPLLESARTRTEWCRISLDAWRTDRRTRPAGAVGISKAKTAVAVFWRIYRRYNEPSLHQRVGSKKHLRTSTVEAMVEDD